MSETRDDGPQTVTVQLVVNGTERELTVEPRHTLADVLREQLGLTGVRLGCEQGACGACSVLIDGEPACSCLALAVEADGSAIETIEGLSASGRIADLQASFQRNGAFQCGYCTAGFLVVGEYLLSNGLATDREHVVHELHGNICRCTGYNPIVDAVLDTAAERGLT